MLSSLPSRRRLCPPQRSRHEHMHANPMLRGSTVAVLVALSHVVIMVNRACLVRATAATGTVLPPAFSELTVNSTTTTTPWMASAGDLDGDGNVDVVASNYATGASGVMWYVLRASGCLLPQPQSAGRTAAGGCPPSAF